jgi:catechol 2,3-dioxygenase-like lactoylglutathione lyase family enzyme
MNLEVVTLPVSDVDQAKNFYQSLGWRLDADIARGDEFRVVQLTPPHSSCSVVRQGRHLRRARLRPAADPGGHRHRCGACGPRQPGH